MNKDSFTVCAHTDSEPPWLESIHGLLEFLVQLHCSDEYTCSL